MRWPHAFLSAQPALFPFFFLIFLFILFVPSATIGGQFDVYLVHPVT